MQRQEILLNRRLRSNGQVIQSNLNLQNNYYVYTQNLGGGLTNEFNVRAYLNDPQNQLIIDQFIVYMQNNTTDSEFLEIFYDDNKLQNVFNAFFESELQGQNVSVTAIIDQSLSNTISIVVNDNVWNWDGNSAISSMTGLPESVVNATRNENSREELVSHTSEDSYYVPVKINYHTSQIPRNKFKVCDNIVDIRLNPIEYYLTSQGMEFVTGSDFVVALNNFRNQIANNQNNND